MLYWFWKLIIFVHVIYGKYYGKIHDSANVQQWYIQFVIIKGLD